MVVLITSMKTKLILLTGMFFVLTAAAQSNFRMVKGQLYNSSLSTLWKVQHGKIADVQENGIILQTFTTNKVYQNVFVEGVGTPGAFGGTSDHNEKRLVSSTLIPAQRLFINNYSSGAIDQEISIRAIKTGTIKITGQVLEEWDAGKPYVPPPPTPEQLAAIKLKQELDKKRAMEGQTNAVHWLQSQATNGDVSAQCSLAEHYLNGQGCETNRDLAIQWLQKAADAGSMEASNKLSQLKAP